MHIFHCVCHQPKSLFCIGPEIGKCILHLGISLPLISRCWGVFYSLTGCNEKEIGDNGGVCTQAFCRNEKAEQNIILFDQYCTEIPWL